MCIRDRPYPIRNWFSPSALMEKLGQNTAAANQALAAADNSFMTDPNGLNLRDYQIKAIDKATEAIVDGKRTALEFIFNLIRLVTYLAYIALVIGQYIASAFTLVTPTEGGYIYSVFL